MEQVLEQRGTFVVRFDRGDEVMAALRTFCRQQGIAAASFSGIGAGTAATLSFYLLAAQRYEDEAVEEEFEICSLLGNIATLDGEVVVHAHGTLADRSGRVRGGHIKRLVVGATCELTLATFAGPLHRTADPTVGLPLLKR